MSDGKDTPVRVLTLHGMIVPKFDYSLEMQAAIAASMGLTRKTPLRVTLARGYEAELLYGPQPIGSITSATESILTKTEWVDASGKPAIVFYELFWAPLRDHVKFKYFGCFQSQTFRDEVLSLPNASWDCKQPNEAKPNGDARVWINAAIKDGLMVRGFADASIVNGRVGDILKDDLALATCAMAADVIRDKLHQKEARDGVRRLDSTKAPELSTLDKQRCDPDQFVNTSDVPLVSFTMNNLNPEYFVITESLGSYLFLNAQVAREMVGQNEGLDNVQFQMFDAATVYMFANQVALLGLSDIEAVCKPPEGQTTCPNYRLRTTTQWVEASGAPGNLTTYVAFNDADDDLGFELPPYLAETGLLGRTINVSVRNPALTIPFLVRHPGEVHTNQDKNPAVIDAIVNGMKLPGGPPIPPLH